MHISFNIFVSDILSMMVVFHNILVLNIPEYYQHALNVESWYKQVSEDL